MKFGWGFLDIRYIVYFTSCEEYYCVAMKFCPFNTKYTMIIGKDFLDIRYIVYFTSFEDIKQKERK